MEGASIENALARIEAALTRIENAASRAPTADHALAARHESLRAAVTQSLHQLDTLISGLRS
jgi:capsule polysaccharide export protein KpsE/RkpR